jgi:hypothetical protein
MTLSNNNLEKIPGYENLYAGLDGNIYLGAQIQETRLDPNGYLRWRGLPVHRLVALAFYGKCPEGWVVRHKNDIKTDNRPSNIAYGTQMENMDDSYLNGCRGLCKTWRRWPREERDMFTVLFRAYGKDFAGKVFGLKDYEATDLSRFLNLM